MTMRHRFPAVVAVLLVVAVLAASVSSVAAQTASVSPTDTRQSDNTSELSSQRVADTPIVGTQNTTSYLALPQNEIKQRGYKSVNLDVAGAAAIDSRRLHDQFRNYTTFKEFKNAPNSSARTDALEETIVELENRSATLRTKQAKAIRAYNDGSISTETFFRRLAIINSHATQLNKISKRLQNVRDPTYSLPNQLRIRLQGLQAQPSAFLGPLRRTSTRAIAGKSGPPVLYVETSTEGVVIAQIEGDRYVREAYDGSSDQIGGIDQFKLSEQDTIEAAFTRARELYPWTFENDLTIPSARGFGLTSTYQITVDHSQGELISYLDGTTTDVFREVQNKRLDALPVLRTVTKRRDNLTLTANVTHATGPLQLTTSDASQNSTVNATISLNGRTLGHTGPDGQRWVIQPTGPVTINATTGTNRSVEFKLSS